MTDIITDRLECLQAAAIRSTAPCQFAVAQINGKEVEAYVVTGYRNTGKNRKPTIQWKVDGRVVAKANLAAALA